MGKLKKTSLKRCQKCEYYYGQTCGSPICGYFHYTGNRKTSPIGFCGEEFKPRTTKFHKVKITILPKEGGYKYI